MKTAEMIERYFNETIASEILKNPLEGLNEVRIRKDKPIILRYGDRERVLGLRLGGGEIGAVAAKMSEYSPYAFKEEIKQGYLTLKGGFRVGLCGKAVTEGGKIKTIRDFTSMNIRIPLNVRGCGAEICGRYEKGFKNTLIVSPPGCGKTTMLRDIIRYLSGKGYNVGVCDERGELDCFRDLGERADVICGGFKAQTAELLIRGLCPDIIAMDELGGEEDKRAVLRASYMGVGIIATLHGEDFKKGDYPSVSPADCHQSVLRQSRKHICGSCFRSSEGTSGNNIPFIRGGSFGDRFKIIVVLENKKGKGVIKEIYEYDYD